MGKTSQTKKYEKQVKLKKMRWNENLKYRSGKTAMIVKIKFFFEWK